jgi:phospholipase/carboxylesterase
MADDPLVIETGVHKPDACVIWLHGLGADGHDFEPIVPELRLDPGLNIRFVFPHAPMMPVTINQGFVMRAWYDIRSADIGAEADEKGIRASAELVGGLID